MGSVEFLRECMAAVDFSEPASITYPVSLQPFLRRKVWLAPRASVGPGVFVKPCETKRFTGFVVKDSPFMYTDYEAEQWASLANLPADAAVWLSEAVQWQAEHRYYVLNGEILGSGRYDDGPDDWAAPDIQVVRSMVETYCADPEAPIAFALDAGVLANGETALVEVNDAWAIGLYRGSLSAEDYLRFLVARWRQLAESAKA